MATACSAATCPTAFTRSHGQNFSGQSAPLLALWSRLAEPIGEPAPIDDAAWESLHRFGGFSAPLARQEMRFWRRWQRLRRELLLREDLRDLSKIQEVGQLEVLATLLEA